MLHCPWSAIQLGMAAHTGSGHGSMTKTNPKLTRLTRQMETESVRRRWRKLERRRHMASKTTRITRFVPSVKLLPSYYQESGSVCCSFLTRMAHCRLSRRCAMLNNFSALISRVSNTKHHKGHLPISTRFCPCKSATQTGNLGLHVTPHRTLAGLG